MAVTPYSNSKLKNAVYIVLISTLVFMVFQLADKERTTALIWMNNPVAARTLVGQGAASKPSDTSGKFENRTDLGGPIRKENLMFVKTHKCGTSTLVNLFYLLGIRKRLNFVMHPYTHELHMRVSA